MDPSTAALASQSSDLNFRVPNWRLQQLRRAKVVNPDVKLFWTIDWYLNDAGKPIRISYADNVADSEKIAQRFIDEPVIGFDMEWKSSRIRGVKYYTLKENVSLIQIARDGEVGLIHIARHKGTKMSEVFAPTLLRLIQSPDVLKTGVAIHSADGAQLRKYAGIEAQGLFELSRLYRMVESANKDDGTVLVPGMVSLAKQVQRYLGFPLSKGRVRTSDWTQPLSPAQRKYAANDAYAGLALFHAMNAKRLRMDNPPPLGTAAEARARVAKHRAIRQTLPAADEIIVGVQSSTSTKSAGSSQEIEISVSDREDEENAFEPLPDNASLEIKRPSFRVPPPPLYPIESVSSYAAKELEQIETSTIPGCSHDSLPEMKASRSNATHQPKDDTDVLLPIDPNIRAIPKARLQALNETLRLDSAPKTLRDILDRLKDRMDEKQAPLHRLVTDKTLEALVTTNPKNVADLCRIPGAVPLMYQCKAQGINLIQLIRDHKTGDD